MKVSIWNLENLAERSVTGPRQRIEPDYAWLRGRMARIGADVWMVQEVESEAALRRVLPQERAWKVFTGQRATGARRRIPIRTAIAVHERLGDDVTFRTVRLGPGLFGARDAVHCEVAGVSLLSVHLKAGCWKGAWSEEQSWRNADLPCPRQWVQSRAVARWLAQEGLRIAGGDFNRRFDVDDAQRRRLVRKGNRIVPAGTQGESGSVDWFVFNHAANQHWPDTEARPEAMPRHESAPDHEPISIVIATGA